MRHSASRSVLCRVMPDGCLPADALPGLRPLRHGSAFVAYQIRPVGSARGSGLEPLTGGPAAGLIILGGVASRLPLFADGA